MNIYKTTFGVLWWVLVTAPASRADKWRWPEGEAAASVRIDTKVRFIEPETDKVDAKRSQQKLLDELPFREPQETEGFYNRPPGAGRYPVRVEAPRAPYRVDGDAIYRVDNQRHQVSLSDGTLDSLQYCKCVSNPDCHPKAESLGACGVGKYLCCYQRPNNKDRVSPHKNEFFNELEDERPILLPGREDLARPFPPPPDSSLNGLFANYGPGPDRDSAQIGVYDKPLGILVGPNGPSGVIGPEKKRKESDVLVGPGGPTGIIGPAPNRDETLSETAQRGVLVGSAGSSWYGRRPVLVGPGGPTGIIGPNRNNRGPNVLVGPGGPTGIIGPGYGRQPGILTGPGGPTGSIGPGRQILVGPGGPTGQIGPHGLYGK